MSHAFSGSSEQLVTPHTYVSDVCSLFMWSFRLEVEWFPLPIHLPEVFCSSDPFEIIFFSPPSPQETKKKTESNGIQIFYNWIRWEGDFLLLQFCWELTKHTISLQVQRYSLLGARFHHLTVGKVSPILQVTSLFSAEIPRQGRLNMSSAVAIRHCKPLSMNERLFILLPGQGAWPV